MPYKQKQILLMDKASNRLNLTFNKNLIKKNIHSLPIFMGSKVKFNILPMF